MQLSGSTGAQTQKNSMFHFVNQFIGLYCKEKKKYSTMTTLDISYTYLEMDYKYNSG